MNRPRYDASSHGTDHSDNEWVEKAKNGGGTKGYSQRTHKAWLRSDEMRLLSSKDEQGMKWKAICGRFLYRTPGAVQARYSMLHKRRGSKIMRKVKYSLGRRLNTTSYCGEVAQGFGYPSKEFVADEHYTAVALNVAQASSMD
jgi:hypothetical protein